MSENRLIGVALFLSILCGTSLFTPSVYAVLNSITDGWDSTDDPYATSTDRISFSTGSGVDGRFTFDATASEDMYCIAIASAGDRSQNILVDGDQVYNLALWAYHEFAADAYIQNIGGDDDTCRFYYWSNKDCTGDTNDAIWLTSAADYTTAGCTPDTIGAVDEGVTSNLGGVDFTCVDAIVENYRKCQAATPTKLNDCIDDSLNGVNGGDDLALYETCQDSDTGSDTEHACDTINPVNGWELAYLDADHLSALADEIYSSGVPNASFTLYSYDLCGTAGFDRDVVSTFDLVQFQSKQRLANGTYGYNVTGYVRGWFPWYGVSGYVNESYSYGTNFCEVGTVSQDSEETTSNNEDLDSGACFIDGGSCYDGETNQDEIDEDYGGLCGSCDNSTPENDLYWGVAYQSNPSGYYDENRFNATIDCPAAEENVNFTVVTTVIFQVLLFTLLFILLAVASYLIFGAGAGFLIGAASRSLRRNKPEKQLLNNRKEP